MGCNACKGEDERFWESQAFPESSHPTRIPESLLTAKERQIWSENLLILGVPEAQFWEKHKSESHPSFNQIKKDIARSFPQASFFKTQANATRFQILLRKFALYFPKLGYTQGLNFVAGYLLISGFTDSQAFELLVGLALNQKILLLGLYEDDFPLNRLYCALFWKLLGKRLPRTAEKIKKAQVPDESWIFQWFMSFFLYSFPVQFVKKLMDYVVCKKNLSIVTISIGIVNCLKQDIHNMVSPDEFDFFQYFDAFKDLEHCQQKIDSNKVISYANSFSQREIKEALSEIRLKENIYYVYFLKEQHRKEIWNSMVKKLSKERSNFRADPRSTEYRRNQNAVEHLERFLLKKSKLYQSRVDSRFSSQIRTSNFTLDLEPSKPIVSNRSFQSEKVSHLWSSPFEEKQEVEDSTNSRQSKKVISQIKKPHNT